MLHTLLWVQGEQPKEQTQPHAHTSTHMPPNETHRVNSRDKVTEPEDDCHQSSVAGGSVLRLTLTGYWRGVVGCVSPQVLRGLRGGLRQPLRAAAVTDAVGKHKRTSASLLATPARPKVTYPGQNQAGLGKSRVSEVSHT